MTDEMYAQLLGDIRRLFREEIEAYRGNGNIKDVDALVDANVEPEIDLGDDIN